MKGNVLFVSNYPSDTGYAWWLMEHFWCLFSERLPTGSVAHLVYPKVTSLTKTIEDSNIKVHELDFFSNKGNRRSSTLKFIKKNNIRTVYLTDAAFFSTFYFWLRVSGVATIIVHDHTPGDRPPITGLKGIVKAIRNRLSPFTADAVFNVSPLMRERSISNGRIPYKKCFSVQNGLLIDRNPSFDSRPIKLKTELLLSNEAKLVVCSSRLHSYKNVQFAIRAFDAATCERQADEHLIIIGDGPYEKDLKEIAESLQCYRNVHFLGFRDDVSAILPQCDVAIHCSRGEGFSLSIIEFMLAGLPLLVPDIPSVSQAIEDGMTGMIYENESIEDARSKLRALLDNEAKRRQLGKSARSVVEEHYTLKNTDQQFRAALEALGL